MKNETLRMRFVGKVTFFALICCSQSYADGGANCWVEAGDRYGIEPWLLYSVAEHESKLRPSAISKRNSDGTYDIGIMQVNSWWLGRRAKPTDPPRLGDYGITEQHLMEPCLNIHVGAWILAQAVKAMGPTWEAVGAYNAGVQRTKARDEIRKNYADRIARIYSRHNDRMRNASAAEPASRP